MRVTNRFFGIRDFPYLKLGIRDLKAKSRRDSGLKVYARGGMPKITLGITGLKNPIGDPSKSPQVTESKTVLDSGFCCCFRIKELDSGFLFSGIWIPDSSR